MSLPPKLVSIPSHITSQQRFLGTQHQEYIRGNQWAPASLANMFWNFSLTFLCLRRVQKQCCTLYATWSQNRSYNSNSYDIAQNMWPHTNAVFWMGLKNIHFIMQHVHVYFHTNIINLPNHYKQRYLPKQNKIRSKLNMETCNKFGHF